MSRGISLNNPGNIRISDTSWKGKVVPSRDPAFETFDTPENGVRAMAKILLTYLGRGLDTVAKIIPVWAPPGENNDAAYISDVADRSGFSVNEKIERDADSLSDLIYGMVVHEDGSCPYDDDLIDDAVDDALNG